jgi:hypothetical protein
MAFESQLVRRTPLVIVSEPETLLARNAGGQESVSYETIVRMKAELLHIRQRAIVLLLFREDHVWTEAVQELSLGARFSWDFSRREPALMAAS